MFKSASGEGGRAAGLVAQESSWLGLLSRPALAFVSKYVPGLGGWRGGHAARDEDELLRRLDASASAWSWREDGEQEAATSRTFFFAWDLWSSWKDERTRGPLQGGHLLSATLSRAVHEEETFVTGDPGSGGAPADPDNGYHSLEEERCRDSHIGPPDDEKMHVAEYEEGLSTAQETGSGQACHSPGYVSRMAAPQCRNASIAFIMGCPYSDDDDDSQTEADSAHDDGFESSDSSDLSSDWSSSDEEENSAADEETARLLASLCRHDDPYNPQNFSARLQTGCTAAPRPLPAAQDTWDDSSGEADEAESLLLLASLTPSDPYSLLNFRAPLSTGKAQTPPLRVTRAPTTGGCMRPFNSAKKVRFSDVVEEFVIASGADAAEEEDRRGPWEELARDRGRFLRRCQEAELSLAYCLQPEHRRRVYRRINGHDCD
ncbi:protein phosphatase 1 regulatory subunit 15B-like [Festucalex cinctus]